jgi:hypothetical protein
MAFTAGGTSAADVDERKATRGKARAKARRKAEGRKEGYGRYGRDMVVVISGRDGSCGGDGSGDGGVRRRGRGFLREGFGKDKGPADDGW